MSLSWLALTISLTQSENGVSSARLLRPNWPAGMSLGSVLIINWWRSDQCTAGDTIPWAGSTNCIRKLAKYKSASKTVSYILPWFMFQVPTWVTGLNALEDGLHGSWNNPFFPLNCSCLEYFITTIEWTRTAHLATSHTSRLLSMLPSFLHSPLFTLLPYVIDSSSLHYFGFWCMKNWV